MRFEKFIIRLDDNGKEIKFTCDESKLANKFGKNPEAPNFLTRVFFKKINPKAVLKIAVERRAKPIIPGRVKSI